MERELVREQREMERELIREEREEERRRIIELHALDPDRSLFRDNDLPRSRLLGEGSPDFPEPPPPPPQR